MDENEEKQEYVHQVNDLPLAGSQAVPDSPLAKTIDSKVKDVILNRSGDSPVSLVENHEAIIKEMTETDMTDMADWISSL